MFNIAKQHGGEKGEERRDLEGGVLKKEKVYVYKGALQGKSGGVTVSNLHPRRIFFGPLN